MTRFPTSSSRNSCFSRCPTPKKDIHLYINSPGGSVTAGLAIYDTMQYLTCDVNTYCVGQAASMARGAACGGHERQTLRPAQRAHPDSPAVGRRAGPGLRHQHPGEGNSAAQGPAERNSRQTLRAQADRGTRARHRPRPFHVRPRKRRNTASWTKSCNRARKSPAWRKKRRRRHEVGISCQKHGRNNAHESKS